MTWPDVHYKKLTVPAWVECDDPSHYDDEFKHLQDSCKQCNGDGGKWHEAVEPMATVSIENDPIITSRDPLVTRSTILYQLYDPCGKCGGRGRVPCGCGGCRGLFPQISEDIKPEDRWKPCKSCLMDSDGPTGAAEGTGQGWKVEL